LVPLPGKIMEPFMEPWNVQHFKSEDHRANVTMIELAGESR
jgi:hypothetical protein